MRERPFRLLCISRAFSTLAFQIQAVAVGWQIYALTSSPFQLGMVGLAQFLPMVLLNLAVGHFADRHDRRRIVSVCQFIEGTAAAALAIGSFTAHLSAAAIYTAVAVIGAARAFEGPTMQALVPGLVDEAMLPQAIALSTSAFQTASIAGPAVGGFLYALGVTTPYAVAAALFLSAGFFSGGVRVAHTIPRREPATLKSVFSGLHFIRSRPAVLGAISLDLFAVLLGGATALLPVFAKEILHTGPWGLGVLRAAPALGAVAMSFTLAHKPLKGRAGMIMFCAVMGFGAATIVFGLSSSVYLSLAALFALGAFDVVSVVIRQSLVQLQTPDEMRGRVSAVNSLFIGTSNQLGEFESGVTAAWFGTVPAVVIGGIGSIAVAGLWMFLFPDLRKLERLHNGHD
ncbi:MAG: MFS transporter [Bryobacteraceae bacterium]